MTLIDTVAHQPGSEAVARGLSQLTMMLRIRAFEETALDLTRRGEVVGAVHPCTGHEAIAAGVCDQLGPRDEVVSYYRCHGHAVASGPEPAAMFAELLGRASGLNKGQGRFDAPDPAIPPVPRRQLDCRVQHRHRRRNGGGGTDSR